MDLGGFRYFLFGAQAVVVHGIPRLTADIDVSVDLGGNTPAELLAALATEGIVPRAIDFDALVKTARLWPLVHASTRTPIDLVLIGDGIDRVFLGRAQLIDIAGTRVPVLSVEDLIATKVITTRRKDRDDVLGLLSTQGDRLDFERVRTVLRDLDATLDEPRALRRFEALVRAHRRTTR